MLSALDQSSDKIKGLKAGADDYVSKPFNYEELLLRIEKQLEKNRIEKGKLEIVKLYDNRINFTAQIIMNEAGEHLMNQKECTLLKYLYENKNRAVSREELYANVWSYEFFPNSRTVDNHIASLRKMLHPPQNMNKSIIQSARGIGYKLLIEDF